MFRNYMNLNQLDWYEYIVKNHFNERNVQVPIFFTREFINFKLPNTPTLPITTRDKKVIETKQIIYRKIHTLTTEQLMNLICNTSFIHL